MKALRDVNMSSQSDKSSFLNRPFATDKKKSGLSRI